MSLTVEALAKEIRQIDENYGAGDQLATALLAFIERHISAGQTPKPAELAAEYCRGRDDGWEAAEQKYRQPPKPAGAVPLPEPAIRAWQPATEYPDNGHTVFGYTAEQLRAYGDAREAAGRAVAVNPAASAIEYHNAVGPIDAMAAAFSAMDNNDTELEEWPQRAIDALAFAGWAVVPYALPFEVLGEASRDGAFATGNPKHGWDYLVAKTRIGPHGPPAPIPQQPAADGAKSVPLEIVGWVHEDQLPDGYPYDAMFAHSKVDGVRMFPVFAPIPQQPEAEGAAVNQSLTTQAEGDDIAVDRFAEAMKAKMAAARAKGRGGWEGPTCNAKMLSDMLRNHVEKGDPRDVANFCMMLWNRGESIQAAEGAGREAAGYYVDWPNEPDLGHFFCESPVDGARSRPLVFAETRPTPAADAGGVTDEMVERACEAYDEEHGGYRIHRLKMQRALAAALTPEVRHGE